MTPSLDFGLAPREENEGLFTRDLDGQLVRVDKPTLDDYDRRARVTVNGRAIELPVAEPLKDAQGNVILNLDGTTIPRNLTILDAIRHLNARDADQPEITVPTLCHQPHMHPIAVCRVCIVALYKNGMPDRPPAAPACHYAIKEGMEIYTTGGPKNCGDTMRSVTGMVTDLLKSENLHKAPEWASEIDKYNELATLPGHSDPGRFADPEFQDPPGTAPAVVEPPRGRRTVDSSSPVFHIDHSSCVLCERCIRACTEVKHNNIIGRTGKGRFAGVGFDLNLPMGESHCVQCGECMVSCPTSAITYKATRTVENRKGADTVPIEQLMQDPLFQGVPPKFLLWQKGLVLQRRLNPGDALCRIDDPGHSAWIIRSGELEIKPPGIIRGPKDIIVGEMACLSGTPRTADVLAHTRGEVWEIRRNVLDRMMRAPGQRERFERFYRDHSLEVVLRDSDVFKDVPDHERAQIADFLRGKDDQGHDRLTFVRVNPDRPIFDQGALADCMYLVRLGHVRVGIGINGRESSVFFRGPGTFIGEIGLLGLSYNDLSRSLEQVQGDVEDLVKNTAPEDLPGRLRIGRRTATCTSLDHVEMARIDRNTFIDLIRTFPPFRKNVVRFAYERLLEDREQRHQTPLQRQFVEQGLYQGQSLLVLDLAKCTRCDECTRACKEQHGTLSHGHPLARLTREGLRFGDQLVATSCRSCKDAYCMIGCPVDAIFRGKHRQIVIADHCIGCGLCANNCPYGNIEMYPNWREMVGGVAKRKAATCDQCDREGREAKPRPRCVEACPHDAAHRMTGAEFLETVIAASVNSPSSDRPQPSTRSSRRDSALSAM